MRAHWQIFTIGFLAVACPQARDPGSLRGTEIPAVEVAQVERGSLARWVSGTTVVEARNTVEISAEVGARVWSLKVEEGSRVAEGQVLAILNNPRVHVALERARLEEEHLRQQLESTTKLNQRGYVASRSREDLEYQLRRAELEVKRSQEEERALRIVAPFAGVISRRRVAVGELVTPQRPLFQLVDDTNLLAVLHLPETDMQLLRPGLPVRAEPVALAGPIWGEVLRVAPVVDQNSGTLRVTLRLPSGAGLRPGMLVVAHVQVDRRDQAILVSREALNIDERFPAAFRVRWRDVDGARQAWTERVEVKTGIIDATAVEILEGLGVGDRVVVAGRSALRDGVAVRIISEREVMSRETADDARDGGANAYERRGEP